MEILKEEDRNSLQNLLDSTLSDNPDKLKDMLMLYQKYNIKSLADQVKESYTQLAFERLSAIDIPNDKKKALITLSNQLLIREQ
ncbi:hypothetical protein D3C72_2143750 [compost metagenome]